MHDIRADAIDLSATALLVHKLVQVPCRLQQSVARVRTTEAPRAQHLEPMESAKHEFMRHSESTLTDKISIQSNIGEDMPEAAHENAIKDTGQLSCHGRRIG
jgi:hypothetical protein